MSTSEIMIVLATRNQGKVREFQQILKPYDIDLKSLSDFGPIPEADEDGDTFDDNAYQKALLTAKALGLPAIADDSGLMVKALNGRPGVHSARYAGEKASDADNIARLLREMGGVEERQAAFECVISIAVPSGPALTYEGRCEGEISLEIKGEGGFGYDPVFFYPPLNRTFAQCSAAEKNEVSHRGRALNELGREFDKVLVWLKSRLTELKPPKPDHNQFMANDWSEPVVSG